MKNKNLKLFKLLVWTAIFGGFVTSTVCEPILLKQPNAVHCFTNESSALAWILPTGVNTVQATHDKSAWKHPGSLTSMDLKVLTCDLMTLDCAYWSGVQNSSNYYIEKYGERNFGPLLDYRWNSLPQYFTDGYEKDIQIPIGSLKYKETATFHISVLAEYGANIYLSEGENYKSHRLYWILLDELNNSTRRTLSVIRKCPNGIVKDKSNNCYINHKTETSPILKQGKRWVNLSIQLYRYQTTATDPNRKEALQISVLADGQPVLSWNNEFYAFDVKYIILNTIGNRRGYWKYHKYTLLKPNKNVGKISSPEFEISEPRNLCLSIIYFSNKSAELNLWQEKQTLPSYHLQGGAQWQVIKIEAQLQPSTYKLEFTFEDAESFYLGGIRICHQNEVFMSSLTSTEVKTCEELLTKYQVTYNPVSLVPLPKFDCLGDYFDKACSLSCSAMLGTECRDVTSCGRDYCSCLSGYKTSTRNPQCSKECDNSTFGPNCQSNCGHCVSSEICEKETGVCTNGCEGAYWKPTCNKELPILTLVEDEIEVNLESLTVKIANSERSTIKDLQDYSLLLQYKPAEEKEWKNSSQYKWTPPFNLTISDLFSNQEYQVRAVLLASDEQYGYLGYFGDLISPVSVKTKCNTVDAEKVNTSITTTSIVVNWQEETHDCPLSSYSLTVNNETHQISELPKEIPDLQSNTEYQVVIIYGDKKVYDNPIKTDEIIKKPQVKPGDEGDPAMILIPVAIIIIIALLILGVVVWRRKYRQHSNDSQKININVSADTVTISGISNPAGPTSQASQANQDNQLTPPPLQPKAQTLPRNQSLTPQSELMNQRVSHTPPTKQRVLRKSDSKAGAVEKLSIPIRLSDLENYVEKCFATGEFERQHALFPRGQTQSWDYGRLPENKMKNRYGNLVAYDVTRVKLQFLPGDPHSDYINANYIDGYKHPKAYIATQGPKANTVNDFWRMIWQENSNLIIMVANVVENGKAKCDKYWPDQPQNVAYGDIKIQALTEDVYADYTFRTFNVHYRGQIRKVTHMHYTTWPDHGVPFYPQTVTAFLRKILQTATTGPIVVHCSAGVGRTGTILLCDSCLRMVAEEKRVDPIALLQNMRAQRPNLVDNAEQYEFVHLVLLDCILADTTSIPCARFLSEYQQLMDNSSELLEQQYDRVNKLCKREMLRNRSSMEIIWSEEKSRFPDIAPGNYGRVILNRPLGGSDYINAVYVDGFRTKGQFIASQLPLSNTVCDLWHLVLQTKSPLIVVLNQPQPPVDQTTCPFWPSNEDDFLLPDSTTVVLKRQNITKVYNHLRLQIRCELQEEGNDLCIQHDVNMLMLNGWESGAEVPSSAYDLIQLWEEAERLYSGHGPIIVLCHDGARACGLFLSSVFVIEKMKLEKEVDVGLAVRTSRLTRHHFITSLEQYAYVYEIAMLHQSACEAYANFQ